MTPAPAECPHGPLLITATGILIRPGGLVGEDGGLDAVAGVEAPQRYLFDRWASGGVFAAFVAIIVIAAWYLFKSCDA